MKEDIGKIFFTEYDEKITGASKRDPLGLQPIWSYYGRRVIKHLTTVSGDIRGFRELLLCLSVCAIVNERHNEKRYVDLILLFEQLFIYSAIEKNEKDGILGADNGTVRYNNSNKNPKITVDNTILVREISLGYYGRYKTPLMTMGIIDKNSNICIDIDIQNLYGKDTYDAILKAFEKFVQLEANKQTLNNFSALHDLYVAVGGKLRTDERKFWLDKLQISGKNKINLMAECYSIVDTKQFYSEVFNDLKNNNEVNDIENLEPFLRCMEFVFFQTLKARNINQIQLNNELLKEHKERYAQFLKISNSNDSNSPMLDARLEYIKTYCNPSLPDYIKNIISYHKMVCEQKRSSVWVEVENSGNMQAFIQPDTDVSIDQWGRDYYLSSLLSIKNGIKGLS